MNHISNIKVKHIIEGISGQYIHGDQTTFGLVEVKQGSILPQHQHPHEQITFILEGELEMTIGGETMTLKPGNFHVIHSNVPHSAVAHVDCKLIDVFSPVREDYV
ncbi:MAG TPA: cupin domain-containing protein [Chitinophagaceae bacterium]|nr:cupin domain-containing protein [Chitinophagaceae bacterium]